MDAIGYFLNLKNNRLEFRFHLSYQLSKILRCSHKDAIAYCRNRLINIDGILETNPRKVIGYHEEIQLNGLIVRNGIFRKYLLFYKPPGIECTSNRAIENHLYSALPIEFHDLFPLGRLDTNSEGLLLMTNDGSCYRELMKVEADVEKEYLVFTLHPISPELGLAFENPFQLGQRTTLPARFEVINDFCFRVILKEGINRQIRRICAKNGNQVKQLIRIRFGKQKLGDLKCGEWREVASF